MAEVLEGSSGKDEVKDEVEFFQGRGGDEEFLKMLAFFSAILRMKLLILVFRGRDKTRNFASFLGQNGQDTLLWQA